MAFAKVFPCLIAKAERKGRTREEVLFVTNWWTSWQRDGRLRRLREIEIDLWNSTDTGFLILRHITERTFTGDSPRWRDLRFPSP
ncbi:MAG: DUF2200 family protein, partial [Candidatus Cryptobacteroides sp.]